MEWISIEDTLPQYSELVLVAAVKDYENGEVEYLIDIADRRFTNKDGHCWMNRADNLRGWYVTHWMHLPEPPKQ